MNPDQRAQPVSEGSDKSFLALAAAFDLLHQRVHRRERILHAVIQFESQQFLLRFELLSFGDIPANGRRAEDCAIGVQCRGDCELDLNGPAILAQPDCLVLAVPLALAQVLHRAARELHPLRGHEGQEGLADDLGGCVLQQAFRGGVP